MIAAAYADYGFAQRRLTAALLPKLSANSDAEADQAWVEWLRTAKKNSG